MSNLDSIRKVIGMLEIFISGKDQTLGFAGEIEVSLDELFPDDDEIQNFVTSFASYRPGGGELLYNEQRMVQESKILLKILESRY